MNPSSEHIVNGELVPQGGGDSIPLTRSPLVIGRRESCDICLQFPNVSGQHCELIYKEGLWVVHDLNSTNGVTVNEHRLDKGASKVLHHGDCVGIAARLFTIEYHETGRAADVDESGDDMATALSIPLLEKAALAHPPRHRRPEPTDDEDDPTLSPGADH
ncbi:MAG: FHA domain-containing protein [Planctomycetes bacterium]|nr:FHA domain-containing protein [Planctomycetota bacterium]